MEFLNHRSSWQIYWNWTFDQNMAWREGRRENETRLSNFYMTNSRGETVYLPTWMRVE